MFTISDLKKHLGPGLGLRKNQYLLEIPVPGIEGEKLNVLCRSAGLPERNISTTTIFHKGRKYNIRGETDYIGTFEVTIMDDSDMSIRQIFDKWLKKVDNSKPLNAGIFSGASYEEGVGAALGVVKSGVGLANQIKNAMEEPGDAIGGFFLGMLDKGQATSVAKYQTDINIWQLATSNPTTTAITTAITTSNPTTTTDITDITTAITTSNISSGGQEKGDEKLYGYKLQNAFPSSIGIVTLGDAEENALSEFSVVFTFSEFIPLENIRKGEQLGRALAGDDIGEIF